MLIPIVKIQTVQFACGIIFYIISLSFPPFYDCTISYKWLVRQMNPVRAQSLDNQFLVFLVFPSKVKKRVALSPQAQFSFFYRLFNASHAHFTRRDIFVFKRAQHTKGQPSMGRKKFTSLMPNCKSASVKIKLFCLLIVGAEQTSPPPPPPPISRLFLKTSKWRVCVCVCLRVLCFVCRVHLTLARAKSKGATQQRLWERIHNCVCVYASESLCYVRAHPVCNWATQPLRF